MPTITAKQDGWRSARATGRIDGNSRGRPSGDVRKISPASAAEAVTAGRHYMPQSMASGSDVQEGANP
jgi:hypothetical protein